MECRVVCAWATMGSLLVLAACGGDDKAGARCEPVSVVPEGVEQCDAGRDTRCLHADQDGDGLSVAQGDCDDADQDGDGDTPNEGDCDDEQRSVHPEALEVCGDKIDNDCDGNEDDKNCPFDVEDGPVDLALSSDAPITLKLTAPLPDPRAGEVGGDIMFAVDLTASYEDDIATYRSLASEITTSLAETFQDLHIGLAGFRDAPCDGLGGEVLEYGYRLHLPLTSDLDQFAIALDAMSVAPGNTEPEAALEGMYQALTGAGYSVNNALNCGTLADIEPTEPGWEPGRIPLLVVSTDAPSNRPGDPDYPYPTSVQQVIDTAAAIGVSIFFMSTGDSDPDEATIAEATGGAQFELASDSDGIVVALGQALDEALSRASCAGAASSIRFGCQPSSAIAYRHNVG